MRARVFALSVVALALGLVGAAAPQASAHPPSPAPSTAGSMPGMDHAMPGMDMAGMDHAAPAAPAAPASGAAVKQDRSAAIARARLKPLFLQARLDGRQEGPVAGKPPLGDPDGSATPLVQIQSDRGTFPFTWEGINATPP